MILLTLFIIGVVLMFIDELSNWDVHAVTFSDFLSMLIQSCLWPLAVIDFLLNTTRKNLQSIFRQRPFKYLFVRQSYMVENGTIKFSRPLSVDADVFVSRDGPNIYAVIVNGKHIKEKK